MLGAFVQGLGQGMEQQRKNARDDAEFKLRNQMIQAQLEAMKTHQGAINNLSKLLATGQKGNPGTVQKDAAFDWNQGDSVPATVGATPDIPPDLRGSLEVLAGQNPTPKTVMGKPGEVPYNVQTGTWGQPGPNQDYIPAGTRFTAEEKHKDVAANNAGRQAVAAGNNATAVTVGDRRNATSTANTNSRNTNALAVANVHATAAAARAKQTSDDNLRKALSVGAAAEQKGSAGITGMLKSSGWLPQSAGDQDASAVMDALRAEAASRPGFNGPAPRGGTAQPTQNRFLDVHGRPVR